MPSTSFMPPSAASPTRGPKAASSRRRPISKSWCGLSRAAARPLPGASGPPCSACSTRRPAPASCSRRASWAPSRSSRGGSRGPSPSSPAIRQGQVGHRSSEHVVPGGLPCLERAGAAGLRPGREADGAVRPARAGSRPAARQGARRGAQDRGAAHRLAEPHLLPDPLGDGRHAAARPCPQFRRRPLDLPAADPSPAGHAAARRRRCGERDPLDQERPTRSAPWRARFWSSATMPANASG